MLETSLETLERPRALERTHVACHRVAFRTLSYRCPTRRLGKLETRDTSPKPKETNRYRRWTTRPCAGGAAFSVSRFAGASATARDESGKSASAPTPDETMPILLAGVLVFFSARDSRHRARPFFSPKRQTRKIPRTHKGRMRVSRTRE